MGMLTEIQRLVEQRLDAEGTIRIGENYQATDIPIPNESISDVEINSDHGQCLWDPSEISEPNVDAYLAKSSALRWDEYPALYLLASTRYDINKAEKYLNELECSTVLSSWNLEDRQIFYTAYSQYGKNFEKIQCWLSHKSIKELVEFYYHSKSSGGISDNQKKSKNVDSKLSRCVDKISHYEDVYDLGELQKDIVKSAGRVTMDNAADLKIVELEDQIKKQIKRNQKRKNEISQLRDKTEEKLKSWESYFVEETQKQIFRWEDQEIYYFTMALKDFGKNYEYISKIIQTKQPSQLEKFYNENCEKFLLNVAYEEYLENQKQTKVTKVNDDSIEEIPNVNVLSNIQLID